MLNEEFINSFEDFERSEYQCILNFLDDRKIVLNRTTKADLTAFHLKGRFRRLKVKSSWKASCDGLQIQILQIKYSALNIVNPGAGEYRDGPVHEENFYNSFWILIPKLHVSYANIIVRRIGITDILSHLLGSNIKGFVKRLYKFRYQIIAKNERAFDEIKMKRLKSLLNSNFEPNFANSKSGFLLWDEKALNCQEFMKKINSLSILKNS